MDFTRNLLSVRYGAHEAPLLFELWYLKGATAFRCLAPAPGPSGHFSPANKVKKRLYCLVFQCLSGLTEVSPLFKVGGYSVKTTF
ncbi:hypothetical protein G3A_16655 [Bacillus sp. 17376]|nr:hypothetical protein G3A_16655 [Bacillus sp. 17376]